MGLLHRTGRAGVVAVMGAGLVALTGAFGVGPAAAMSSKTSVSSKPAVSSRALVTLAGSLSATTDAITGSYARARMTVEVALAPRDTAALQAQLGAVYDPSSPQYQRWLSAGAFDVRYAPTAATTSAVTAYLRGAGLAVGQGSSPFLLTATGSSAQVTVAFHTRLSDYRDPSGVRYFSNSATVQLPAGLPRILGVIGLSDTVRMHSMRQRQVVGSGTGRTAGITYPAPGSCESTYPTKAEFFGLVSAGVQFPSGYGRGPGCNGLSPSQINSIYGAPDLGARARGKGVNLAVFELSSYQASDIRTYAQAFYGSRYVPHLSTVDVDGGPLHPVCPADDICPFGEEYYAGDDEVSGDIEFDLAVAPAAQSIIVYNAPNDQTGQTELDEYTRIARADTAAVISSSWGDCENDVTAAYVQAENLVFEQMALQGQSMFGAAGDSGAFDCIRSDGSTIANVDDPSSQPWVTSVGGTSLRSNPGTEVSPAYPTGEETVWNVDDLCSAKAADAGNGGEGGLFWCEATGAGAGGSSQYWGRPTYQHGPGVANRQSTRANGGLDCSLAAKGVPCREVPDVSANADEYTPYAAYCHGGPSTTNSACASDLPTAAGSWFAFGGTSASSPVWSAIIADRDSYQGRRSGNVNPLLYRLFDQSPATYFHDIPGTGQSTDDNGLFRVTPGYDEATGIGTPRMAALITVKA